MKNWPPKSLSLISSVIISLLVPMMTVMALPCNNECTTLEERWIGNKFTRFSHHYVEECNLVPQTCTGQNCTTDANGNEVCNKYTYDCSYCSYFCATTSCKPSVINIDAIPPSCTTGPSFAPNAHGWFRQDVPVRLESCSDDKSIDFNSDTGGDCSGLVDYNGFHDFLLPEAKTNTCNIEKTKGTIVDHGGTGQVQAIDLAGNIQNCDPTQPLKIDRICPKFPAGIAAAFEILSDDPNLPGSGVWYPIEAAVPITAGDDFKIRVNVIDPIAGTDHTGSQSGRSGIDPYLSSLIIISGPDKTQSIQKSFASLGYTGSSDYPILELPATTFQTYGHYRLSVDIYDRAGNNIQACLEGERCGSGGTPIIIPEVVIDIIPANPSSNTSTLEVVGYEKNGRFFSEITGLVCQFELFSNWWDACSVQVVLRDEFGNPIGGGKEEEPWPEDIQQPFCRLKFTEDQLLVPKDSSIITTKLYWECTDTDQATISCTVPRESITDESITLPSSQKLFTFSRLDPPAIMTCTITAYNQSAELSIDYEASLSLISPKCSHVNRLDFCLDGEFLES